MPSRSFQNSKTLGRFFERLYVYPLLPEALIPVHTIPPSYTTASPTPQLQGEPDTMDVNDKSLTLRHQGAKESSAATPQAQSIPKPILPRVDTRDSTLQ